MSMMLNQKIYILMLTFVLKDLLNTRAHQPINLYKCHVQYKCSDERNYIWATDDERCHIFHNRCLLKVEQCARHNQGRSELFEMDKETCKESCQRNCDDIYEPVCAQFFQDDYLTFSNECQMRNYICIQERAYSFYAVGECVEFLPAVEIDVETRGED